MDRLNDETIGLWLQIVSEHHGDYPDAIRQLANEALERGKELAQLGIVHEAAIDMIHRAWGALGYEGAPDGKDIDEVINERLTSCEQELLDARHTIEHLEAGAVIVNAEVERLTRERDHDTEVIDRLSVERDMARHDREAAKARLAALREVIETYIADYRVPDATKQVFREALATTSPEHVEGEK